MRAETHSDELVQEGEDFGSIRVLLGQGDDCTFEDGHNQLSMAGTNGRLDKDRVDRFTERTVEVVVPDVEIVDPLTGEARGDIVPLFFLLEDEGRKRSMVDGGMSSRYERWIRDCDHEKRASAGLGRQVVRYSPGCLSLAW